MANQLKKLISIEPSGIKKIAGVPLASVKKVAGVLYEAAAGGTPAFLFWENMAGRHLPAAGASGASSTANFKGFSSATWYFHRFLIPCDLNIAAVILPFRASYTSVTSLSGTGTCSISLGLYTLNGSTLNSVYTASTLLTQSVSGASQGNFVLTNGNSYSITPGEYFIGFAIRNSITSRYNASLLNLSIGFNNDNVENQLGQMLFGRMTNSSSSAPATINTSSFDIIGSDVERFPYIIISA